MTEHELEIQRKLELAKEALRKDMEPHLRRLTESQMRVIHYNGQLGGSLGNTKITLWLLGGVMLISGSFTFGGVCVFMGGVAYYFERKANARFLNYLEEFQKKD